MKKALLPPRAALNATVAVAALALLVWRGQAVATGVRQGLVALGQTLIPALFPFLILSEWLWQSGAGKLLTRPFCGIFARLTGLSRSATAALLLGFICGTPVGCLLAAALWKKGEIGKSDRDRLMLFSNNPGLGFMAGAAGGVCGDRRLGIVLWCLATAAALMVCILSRFWFGKTQENVNIPADGIENDAFDLPAAVVAATRSMVKIAGFYLTACALLGGIDELLGKLPPLAGVGIKGLLELSAGVLAAGTFPHRAAFLCCAFFAGFAGLTIALQLHSLAGEAAPPLPLYLTARLFVGALTWILARLYLSLFPLPAAALPAFAPSHAITLPLFLPFLLLLLFYPAARVFRRIRQK